MREISFHANASIYSIRVISCRQSQQETHMVKKSLVIPCPADKGNLINICADAGRRKGDFL